MARVNFGIERGIDLYAENGDLRVAILQGVAAPDGVSGDQSTAPLSSLYFRSGTSEIYKKIANAGAPADWEQLGSGSGSIGNWRPERVDAHTGQVLSAGVTDPTAWSDNDGGFDGNDATVGNYVLDGNCDLWEITVVGGATSITLAAAASAPVADDMFAVRYNLPDPAGQENQAIVTYDGTNCIKVADVDFATATGVNLSGSYAAGSGDPVPGESVESAIQKVDGNNDAQDTLLGTAQGDTDLGTMGGTGTVITDNNTVKGALEELDDQVTTNVTNIGTNTSNIADNTSDIADLRTTTGTSDGDTNYGTFAGDLFADNLDGKALYQRIEDLLDEIKVLEVTGITTITDVDLVPTATVSACKWLVEAFEEATPANKKALEVYALNDGTNVDDTTYARLRLGSNFNLSISVDVSGGNMRLRASSSTAGVTVRARRIQVTNI